jgi:Uma2 family endonuclease
MAQESDGLVTPEQYLALEDAAEERSEYFQGEILPMAPLTFHHKAIVRDIFVALSFALRDRPCRIQMETFRLFVEPSGFFAYPDAMVTCGESRFAFGRDDILTNPGVIFEVASPATREYDLGVKFERYRQLESLREYVVVDSQSVQVSVKRRIDAKWRTTTYTDFADAVTLDSINLTFRVEEIYKTVEF